MSDSRIPDDRQECQPGGMIGLDGTQYAGWTILREMDGTYSLMHNGQTATSGYASISQALDELDALNAAEGLKPVEDA